MAKGDGSINEIRKKDGSSYRPRRWKVRIDCGTDPLTKKRKVISRTVHDAKSDACKERDRVKSELESGLSADGERMTFGEFALQWQEGRESAGEAAGCSPQLALVGGLLHDICKGAPHHELAGGDLLDSLGLPRLAEIVRSHLDVDLPDEAALTERELVCLADKYCLGIRLTPLESRYEEKKRQFRDNAEALTAIEAREQRAQKLAARLAAECGQSPFELARTALASLNLNEAGRH